MNEDVNIDDFRLTPDQLKAAGQLLYGNQWQTDLARSLNVDSRRVRDWLQGRRPIPLGVKHEVIELLKKSSHESCAYAKMLHDSFKE